MKLPIEKLLLLSLLASLLQAGCAPYGPSKGTLREVASASPEYQQIVERIRGIVGEQLDLNPREVDMDLPLSQQKKAADDLDVVEIIMSVEHAFNIEIKDEEIGRDLSVKKLADVVSKKKSLK